MLGVREALSDSVEVFRGKTSRMGKIGGQLRTATGQGKSEDECLRSLENIWSFVIRAL